MEKINECHKGIDLGNVSRKFLWENRKKKKLIF